MICRSLTFLTSACITPDSAVSHLHHFCACLPHEPFIDHSPTIAFSDDDPLTGRTTATLRLPMCLPPDLRSISSLRSWPSKRAATRDACFQAYVALHRAGLLNDNLLPLCQSWSIDDGSSLAQLGATLNVRPSYDPWAEPCMAWDPSGTGEVYRTDVVLTRVNGEVSEDLHVTLTTPSIVPALSSMDLRWDAETCFRARFGASCHVPLTHKSTLPALQSITRLLIDGAASRSTRGTSDCVALFGPALAEDALPRWYQDRRGRDPAMLIEQTGANPVGLVRPLHLRPSPYVFQRWVDGPDGFEVSCTPLTSRRNFLSSAARSRQDVQVLGRHAPLTRVERFPAAASTIDRLPLQYARFGLFIPVILEELRGVMTAQAVRRDVLAGLPIADIRHVVTAITAPAAGRSTNYQRYEFFGDAVLKYIVSDQLFNDHATWPEGFLTRRKSWLVSNQRLAQAALDRRLDAYIVTDQAKLKKWAPPTVAQTTASPSEARRMSRKVLADVVEALIGAAYLDGGLSLATRCVHVFVPHIRPEPVDWVHRAAGPVAATRAVEIAEAVIGRRFSDRNLLTQSLTHPSCGHSVRTESYQRLEFLGDAVLDLLIVRRLTASPAATTYTPGRMTSIRAAVANAQFLGFLCLDHSVETADGSRVEEVARGTLIALATSRHVRLCDLMQHHHEQLLRAQAACLARYHEGATRVRHALGSGLAHPWLLLEQINPDKHCSDLIEAILGAIFLDANRDLAVCEAFIARIGLTRYLDRLIAGEVDVRHPNAVIGPSQGTEEPSYPSDRMGDAERGEMDSGTDSEHDADRDGDAAAEMGWSAETNGCSSGEPAMLVEITTALENMSLIPGQGLDVTASVEQIEVA